MLRLGVSYRTLVASLTACAQPSALTSEATVSVVFDALPCLVARRPQKCDGETGGAGKAGPCTQQCCAYCLADKDCVMARLIGRGCHLVHAEPKAPFTSWNNKSAGITSIMPRR
eukprot:SAG11_NODE_660_length_7893_cov_4.055042_4_plen_114_part_00